MQANGTDVVIPRFEVRHHQFRLCPLGPVPAVRCYRRKGPSGRSIATSAHPEQMSTWTSFPHPGRAVLDAEPQQFTAAGVHDRDRVIVTGPVQATGHTARRLIGQLAGHGSAGRLHVSLLAASPSGEAPSCGAGTRLPVRSLTGAQRRSALSTVGTSRVTTRPRRSHDGRPQPGRDCLRSIEIGQRRSGTTPGNSGPIRCRLMPIAGTTYRSLRSYPANEPPTDDQEGPTAATGDRALTCTYLVAGAGFEPATSGL
jgi:hypothetical protein